MRWVFFNSGKTDINEGFQGYTAVKNPPANAGDTRHAGSIPGSGRPPGVGHGNPLQYSCLENSMFRGAWQAAMHGVTKSRTQLGTHAYINVKFTILTISESTVFRMVSALLYSHHHNLSIELFQLSQWNSVCIQH